jgi:hypothetical protein
VFVDHHLRLLAPYEMLFSVTLGCTGLCIAMWLIYLLACRRVVALRVLSCG